MILTVTLNPCIDHVFFVEGLKAHDTNRSTRQEVDAGGKGINVSRVVAELEADSWATGFLGGATGRWIREVLAEQGVVDHCLEIEGETRQNFAIEDGSGLPPTTVNARGAHIQPSEWDELLVRVQALSMKADWVCLGGSLPPGVQPDAWRILAEAARGSGAKVLIDADGPAMIHGLAVQPDMIKPNIDEAGRILGRVVDPDDAIDAARELYDQLGGGEKIVLLSMGAKGAIAVTEGKTWRAEPIAIEPKSTIGSGDSLIAGFLVGLPQGIEAALKLGSAAGAATAMTDGTEIARRPIVDQLLPKAAVSILAD